MSILEKLYTVDEIAIMTSLTTRTIRTYLRDGLLKGKKIGGQWRFTAANIQNFMNHGKVVSEMENEQKQTVLDFIDGIHAPISGNIQICTIIDLYVPLTVAKQKSDQLCALINVAQDDPCTYHYTYINAEEKARFVLFASPDFLVKAMSVLK